MPFLFFFGFAIKSVLPSPSDKDTSASDSGGSVWGLSPTLTATKYAVSDPVRVVFTITES